MWEWTIRVFGHCSDSCSRKNEAYGVVDPRLGKGKDPALGADTADWWFWESMQCRLLSTFEAPNTNGKIPFVLNFIVIFSA